MAHTGEGVRWRAWSDDAFAEAQAQDKPILLDIGAVWCHWCHVMDDGIPGDPVHRGTYRDPEVQRRIAANFIAIKVDNDRQPDINARYNMGGWPTTVFLTPQGETLYGETYVPPERMVALLDYITDIFRNQKDQIAAQTRQMRAQQEARETERPRTALETDTVAHVLAAIKSAFDFAYGGFGSEPKFPHPAALALVLEQYSLTRDAELRTVAEKTLAGMADGGMYDRYAGGFFRYSTTRDWSIPHFEKMLEDNARLTAVYGLAASVLDEPRWEETVRSAHGWLLSDLHNPEDRTFAGSQDADGEERYYGRPLDVRATLPTPFIDRTVYAGWNALMISSLAERARRTGETKLLEPARRCFAFLRDRMGRREAGLRILHHFWADGRAQGGEGLLVDQTDYTAAALDLYEVTGEADFLAEARASAEFLVSVLQADGGGFFDLRPEPGAIGELARPKQEIGDNAEAALTLLRLSSCTEDARYREAALRSLQRFTGEYRQYSYFAASYARAVAAALGPQLHIVVVGAGGDNRTRALLQEAWRFVSPGKAVEWLDPAQIEPAALASRGYPEGDGGTPRAYVCAGTRCTIASTREDLAEILRLANRPG